MTGTNALINAKNNSRKLTILDLPDELFVAIFSYLRPVEDVLPGLALVCRKWHDLLYYNAVLWKVLTVDPTFYKKWNFSLVVNIIQLYGHHVQTFIWRENTPVYENVFTCLPLLINLKALRIPVLWTKRVIDSVCTLTRLEKVQINGGFSLTDVHLEEVARCLPNLKTITLNACWKITQSGISTVVSKLKQLENIHLKINSSLPLADGRSERALRNGFEIIKGVVLQPLCHLVNVLCLHFVSIEMDELWDVVQRLPKLRKLSISNCEQLHGIRLSSSSLQKLYIYNLWSALFLSVKAPKLKHVTIDSGMQSLEHVELFATNLRRACVNGSNSLRTLKIKSNKLTMLEMTQCEVIDMKSFRETLRSNVGLMSLRLGCISQDSLTLDERMVPSLQELCLLGDFACETLHIRSPSIRLLHTETENDIVTLNHMYITANHLCKVALVGLPALKTLTIQCVSVDCIEMNLCSDDQLILESCVIHALNAIGFLRLFDCKLNLLSVCTRQAKTVVLYRCQLSDYVLQMALTGCPNISHLNLEKCREISSVNIYSTPLKFLNLFGCGSVNRINLDCPELVAVNLGQCSNIRLFVRGIEQALNKLGLPFNLIEPTQTTRWSHDFPPQEYDF